MADAMAEEDEEEADENGMVDYELGHGEGLGGRHCVCNLEQGSGRLVWLALANSQRMRAFLHVIKNLITAKKSPAKFTFNISNPKA